MSDHSTARIGGDRHPGGGRDMIVYENGPGSGDHHNNVTPNDSDGPTVRGEIVRGYSLPDPIVHGCEKSWKNK